MREIALDGTRWESKEDFYRSFLEAVGAPPGHGHNLDALNDSIRGGDLNRINLPYVVRILGIWHMSYEAREVTNRFRELIEDLRSEGYEVDMVCE